MPSSVPMPSAEISAVMLSDQADAQRHQDVGQGRRQDDLGDEAASPAARTRGPPRPPCGRRCARPGRCRRTSGTRGGDGDQHDLERLVDAEPGEEQRHERQERHGPQHLHRRVDRAPRRSTVSPRDHAEHQADGDAERQADRHSPERGDDVVRQVAARHSSLNAVHTSPGEARMWSAIQPWRCRATTSGPEPTGTLVRSATRQRPAPGALRRGTPAAQRGPTVVGEHVVVVAPDGGAVPAVPAPPRPAPWRPERDRVELGRPAWHQRRWWTSAGDLRAQVDGGWARPEPGSARRRRRRRPSIGVSSTPWSMNSWTTRSIRSMSAGVGTCGIGAVAEVLDGRLEDGVAVGLADRCR